MVIHIDHVVPHTNNFNAVFFIFKRIICFRCVLPSSVLPPDFDVCLQSTSRIGVCFPLVLHCDQFEPSWTVLMDY